MCSIFSKEVFTARGGFVTRNILGMENLRSEGGCGSDFGHLCCLPHPSSNPNKHARERGTCHAVKKKKTRNVPKNTSRRHSREKSPNHCFFSVFLAPKVEVVPCSEDGAPRAARVPVPARVRVPARVPVRVPVPAPVPARWWCCIAASSGLLPARALGYAWLE